MDNRIRRLFSVLLVGLLSTTVSVQSLFRKRLRNQIRLNQCRGSPCGTASGGRNRPRETAGETVAVIKVGLVAGACVAVGSAVALSKASPSKPAGAP